MSSPTCASIIDSEHNSNTIQDQRVELVNAIQDYDKKLVVFGLIRTEAFIEYDINIPCAIIEFILLYTFLVNLKWTHTDLESAIISEDGKRVIFEDIGDWISASSNTGWHKGKHQWAIKMIKGGAAYSPYEQVGVITDYKQATQIGNNMFDLGDSLYYSSNTMTIYQNGKLLKQTNIAWKEGYTIYISLDCDNWTLQFWLNQIDLGIYDLIPNNKYYPAISIYEFEGGEFQIL